MPFRRPTVRDPLTWSFLAVAISVLALVLAVVSLHAGGTRTVLEQAAPAAAETGAPAVVAPAETTDPATDPNADATTDPGSTDDSGPVSTELPSPGASYTAYKSDVPIRLPGGNTRSLDLDEPVVNSDDTNTDLNYFPDGSAQPQLDFESAQVAIAKSPDATPDECAQDIQLSPSDQDITVSQDLVICAVTNGVGALNEPAQAKMARTIVNSVSKDDSLNLTVTTWEIPH